MDTAQNKIIIANIGSVKALGDGTHDVLFTLDQEITGASGQYLVFSFEQDGKIFDHTHVLGNSYINTKEVQENIRLKTEEEQFFIPVLKKGSQCTVTGPFNFSIKEKIAHMLVSGKSHKALLAELFVALLIIGSTIFFVIKNLEYKEATPVVKESTEVFIPKKIDYGTTTPPGFSTSTPVEQGVTLSQSYMKEYKTQKQSSIVFSSQKTTIENFNIYEQFLQVENWKIIKTVKNEDKSILSAEKSGDLFDIVILKSRSTSTQPTIKSHVLLNTLKK
jgi:hypothetical protein